MISHDSTVSCHIYPIAVILPLEKYRAIYPIATIINTHAKLNIHGRV